VGEVFNALEVLNRTMKLGLSGTDLLRAEAGFKSAFAQQGNPNPELPSDPVALAEGYELVAELRPRQEAVPITKLATLARKEVARPRLRVDARTLKNLDHALSGGAAKVATPAAKAAGKARKAKS
jgi:hypothetical protein